MIDIIAITFKKNETKQKITGFQYFKEMKMAKNKNKNPTCAQEIFD